MSYQDKERTCKAKAVDDKALKDAFIRVYNDMIKDKAAFFKGFMANVEKVIGKDDSNVQISELTETIAVLEQDMSGLVQLKLRKQIDEEAYHREYQKISQQLSQAKFRKDELVRKNLGRTKDMGKLEYIKQVIGDGSGELTEFDDQLFEAMVAKVLIKSRTEFVFVFESGLEVDLKC